MGPLWHEHGKAKRGRLGTVIGAVFVGGMAAFTALLTAGVPLRRREISRWSGS
jgi:hypothetical protein